jgi:uncharacterized protein (TIGR03435 family)
MRDVRRSSAGVLITVMTIAAPFVVRGAQQTPASADPSRPSFDVASIKQNKSLAGGGTMGPRPGGRIVARNVSLRALVGFAYNLRGYQFDGGPNWITTDRFDIDAMAEGNPPLDKMREMLRTLLEDRFQLVVHRETRQVDGFMLVRTRPDRLGPNLRVSTLDCVVSFSSQPKCREGHVNFGDVVEWKGNGMRMADLTRNVAEHVGKPVTDHTQLSGTFDLELRWSPEMAQAPDLPSIYTALQEQLGLKLESQRVAIEMIVIDRAEHPTPD